MERWKEQYGDTFLCYNGRRPMLVLSDFNTVKKVFADEALTGRDHSSEILKGTVLDNLGLVFSDGDLWKTHRHFALTTLSDLGVGKNWLEDKIIVEVEGICDVLRSANRKPIDPKVQLTNSVSNVICALTFGKRFALNDPLFSRLTPVVTENSQIFVWDMAVVTFPFLMWFPNPVRSKIFRAKENINDLADCIREKVFEHETADPQTAVQDYISAYQTERDMGTNKPSNDTFDGSYSSSFQFFNVSGAAELRKER